jgi:hypothetical protein
MNVFRVNFFLSLILAHLFELSSGRKINYITLPDTKPNQVCGMIKLAASPSLPISPSKERGMGRKEGEAPLRHSVAVTWGSSSCRDFG